MGSNGKRNIVTVLFPHDDRRPKAELERLTGDGYSGAAVVQGEVRDVALESSREEAQVIEDVRFLAKLLWYRRSHDRGLMSFFAQGARSFDDGSERRIGFEADHHVTIYINGEGSSSDTGADALVFNAGRVAPEEDCRITFYFPGLQNVRIGGEEARVLDSGDGWITVDVPKIAAVGAHEVEFVVSRREL